MKILKPGKVEIRKFVCPNCGCIFAESKKKLCELSYGFRVSCPQNGCGYEFTDDGEPYEEPTPTQELDEVKKLMKVIEEFKGDLARISFSNVDLIRFCKHLIANGVTFREG